jgi:hypothetical protein
MLYTSEPQVKLFDPPLFERTELQIIINAGTK